MKTMFSLIAWTTFGAIALTFAFTGHASGWIGVAMAALGIKQALWPSKKNWFSIDAGGCGDAAGCGDSGGCGGCD